MRDWPYWLFLAVVLGLVTGLFVGVAYYKHRTVIEFNDSTQCAQRGGVIVRTESGGYACVKVHT